MVSARTVNLRTLESRGCTHVSMCVAVCVGAAPVGRRSALSARIVMPASVFAAVLLVMATVSTSDAFQGPVGHLSAAFQGPAGHRRARAVDLSLNNDWATPMQMATTKTLRQVAIYRESMETEVEALRSKLEAASKETEAIADSKGQPLPDDWSTPMQMAINKTLRQVSIYGASMESEVEALRTKLEAASKEAEEAQAELQQLRAARDS